MFPFYTLMKTRNNQRFSGVFREYKMGTLAQNGLMTWYQNLSVGPGHEILFHKDNGFSLLLVYC